MIRYSHYIKSIPVLLVIFSVVACNLPDAMQAMPQFNREMRMRSLSPGQVIGSEIGVELGALSNSIDSPVNVAIEAASDIQADQPLNPSLQQVGEKFTLFPEEGIDVLSSAPLILAIEVPDGLPTDSLALATLIPAEESFVGYTEHPGTPAPEVSYWALSPGQYDPAGKRFFVTITSIPEDGRTMTLVSNSPYISPLVDAGIRTSTVSPISQSLASPLKLDIAPFVTTPQQDETVELHVLCVGFELESSQCQGFEQSIPTDFIEAYDFFVNMQGFREPNLQRVADIDASQWPQAAAANIGAFIIRIEKAGEVESPEEIPIHCKYSFYDANGNMQPRTLQNRNGPYGGYFRGSDHSLTICIFESGNPDRAEFDPVFVNEELLRHELFHAIQYAYDYSARDHDYLEGSATVASQSIFSVNREREREFRLINVSLFRGYGPGRWSFASYEAQDFFVFLAQKFDLSLFELLNPILESGLDKFAVDTALRNNPAYPAGYSLSEAYWAWIKNHVYESNVPYQIGDVGVTCELRGNRVNKAEILYDNPRRTDPTVLIIPMPPLVSQLAQVQFEPINTGTYVASILLDTEVDTVRSKIYNVLHATGFCGDTEESREVTFTVSPNGPKLFYALVSNTALDSSSITDLRVRSYMVEIVSPAVNQSFLGGNPINLQAQTFVSGYSQDETDFPVTWHLHSLDAPAIAEGLNSSLSLERGAYDIYVKFGDAFAMTSIQVLSSANSGELILATSTPLPDPQQIITPVIEPEEIATIAPTSTDVVPVTIVGAVLRDENGNGVQDAEDTYVSGIPVYLTLGDVCAIPGNTGQKNTDGSGLYSFNDLTPGNYCVAINPDDFPSIGGVWVPVSGDRIQVSLSGGDLEIVNFFVQPIIN